MCLSPRVTMILGLLPSLSDVMEMLLTVYSKTFSAAIEQLMFINFIQELFPRPENSAFNILLIYPIILHLELTLINKNN